MSTIRFDNVLLRFPSMARAAVDHVSCEVESGNLVVILGPSGCGKTTLLKMVNRLYEPTAGTIYLGDTDIRQLPKTRLRQQIGYVIQQSGLFPHMTVAQNIAVVPRLLGWANPRIQARIDELLDLVALPPGEYRDRYPAQLSGGQQQRVGLARALAGDPQVMLMDEPFGAIDAITRATLQDEILRLQRQLKKTILFVSHDVEEALRLGDRILIMKAGQIVQYDTPFNILTKPADEFVHNLVGADDMVRQLSLLRVATAMTHLPDGYALNGHNGQPTIAREDSLRDALSLILRTGAPKLTVLEDGSPVGTLTLEHIRDSASVGARG
ncbi:ABC transporter ATP-binding protein [Thermoleptolyngbya sp. C42_A2020_037]|uniref:ABC transporter ATP-binding protein n=1 Tax=Thermoleptolyngbya sp. C42_A2020_037 TaxID=2747799 RepID=UPI0019F7EF0B|nr:ABC transporter ATP-binding protein [Thermoleptolyngbya sp. C42_A2020_037]MBF2085573.1 ABC transporter ATP-binding protein [Thermoleptolyngbya sp. C42_A2020_037]